MNLRFMNHRHAAAAIASRVAAVTLAATLGGMAVAPAAYADPTSTIAYDGAHNEITLDTGDGAATSTDLFASFKGLLPGDTVTQDIELSFSHISAGTRLYIQADTSRLTQAQKNVLAQVEATVSFTGDPVTAAVEPSTPVALFAGADATLVAQVDHAAEVTMHLTLALPGELDNDDFAALDGMAQIPWIITVQEEDGEDGDPASTALTPHAVDLVAYEGGMGTDATALSVGNALPDPEWANMDWSSARITVDNQVWDETNPYWSQGTDGLPFRWAYGSTAADPVAASARVGVYHLMVYPIEDASGTPVVVTVNGKLLVLGDTSTEAGDGYVVTTSDGSDVMVQVRDVTDNAAADALATSHFKNVYGEEASSLARVLSGALVSDAFAADPTAGALAGEFNALGTHSGDCDSNQPHAHVDAGVGFTKNGKADIPVNDDARIGLLWDDFIPGVLGEASREDVLDAKARAAVGGEFATSDEVSTRFKYLDLVDMNDGNLWVATADGSAVTVFVPYFEGLDADDAVALAYFDGLTRDYTVDMAAADLDAEIAATQAHALEVTKLSDGIVFEVPFAQFGPFELMWIDGADEGGAVDQGHDEYLTATGDTTFVLVAGIGAVAVVAIIAGVVLARRKRQR